MNTIYIFFTIAAAVDFNSCEYATTNDQRIKWLEEGVVVTQSILNKYNISSWVVQGTLLGAYRDKSMMSWTSDADIQTFTENIALLCSSIIMQEFNRLGYSVHTCLGNFARVCRANVTGTSKSYITNSDTIESRLDIYGATLRTDGLYDVTFSPCKWNLTQLFPLKPYKLINNITFFGPKNPNPWLVMSYGQDWQTPIKYSGNVADKCHTE